MSVEGGLMKYYGWDGGQVIAEYDAVGTNDLRARASYVYLGGRLLATMGGEYDAQINHDGDVRFHHPDRLGSRISTDSTNGELVTEQMGMPFGTQQPSGAFGGDNTWQHTSKPNPSRQRFTSYDRSNTSGLDYAVNRYYNAAQGRFTQVDPIGMDATSLSDPQSLNLYAYCGNDPINHVDPDGLFWGKVFGIFKLALRVIGIAAAVAVVLAASWGFGTILGVPLWKVAVLAGAAIAASFGAGKLSGILSGIAGIGNVNFKTPPINSETGVSGVSSYLTRAKNKPKPLPLYFDQIMMYPEN